MLVCASIKLARSGLIRVPRSLMRHRSGGLKPEIAQRRVIVGAAAKRPVVLALALLDRQIVDAGDAQTHQAMFVEFPVLIAVAAEPVAAVVMPLIGEAHGNAILAKSPDLLCDTVCGSRELSRQRDREMRALRSFLTPP